MRAGSNADVQRLLDSELANVRRVSGGFPRSFKTPRETIAALLSLLALRQRYFALLGEHFSVFSFDGIVAMDRLDEALLVDASELLGRRPSSAGNEATERALGEAMEDLPVVREHPVGYEVLFLIRRMFEAFDEVLEFRTELEDEGLREPWEAAFLDRLALAIAKFVTDRKTPVARHFSDVQREHLVVERLHCRCGEAKFSVTHQSLMTEAGGAMVDRLEVRCAGCGASHSLEFPLPFIGDLTVA
ncbi:MAG: hypothetical protein HUU15_15425 [Candidatus Brocadiae bacterium]|nr:hypothetical protein [Candidatus Brocadiia bacterium]